ncbi:MAG: hypothetical protein JW741_29275 [Sedimentisphaerales bacterium]|nr:hypothetical protein [Sedimentisphaerales bacterium]
MGANTKETKDRVEKKMYVEPKLEKAERLQEVTEGVAPIVSGAAPAPA